MNMLTKPEINRAVTPALRMDFSQICGPFCEMDLRRKVFLAFQTQAALSDPETGKYGGFPYSFIFGKAFVAAARQKMGIEEMGNETQGSYKIVTDEFERYGLEDVPSREEWRDNIKPFLQMLPEAT